MYHGISKSSSYGAASCLDHFAAVNQFFAIITSAKVVFNLGVKIAENCGEIIARGEGDRHAVCNYR